MNLQQSLHLSLYLPFSLCSFLSVFLPLPSLSRSLYLSCVWYQCLLCRHKQEENSCEALPWSGKGRTGLIIHINDEDKYMIFQSLYLVKKMVDRASVLCIDHHFWSESIGWISLSLTCLLFLLVSFIQSSPLHQLPSVQLQFVFNSSDQNPYREQSRVFGWLVS